MTRVYNRKGQTGLRKNLRKRLPDAELILWSKLKNKQVGVKFRRQYGVENYVIDFYCPELKLAIEVDGDSHYMGDGPEKDGKRNEEIQKYGISMLRFSNEDIYRNLNGVLITLEKRIEVLKRKSPSCVSSLTKKNETKTSRCP